MPAWTTSLDSAQQLLLTSQSCSQALANFFGNTSTLAVATESSSHPSGLQSVYSQPWLYAGGGLGNIDECPLQTCLAGRRDSVTFAAVCVVPECTAYDLAANDFVSTLERVSRSNNTTTTTVVTDDTIMALEYVTIFQRISQINSFMNTGWVCGEYKVPWEWWPVKGPFICILLIMLALTLLSTLVKRSCHRKRVHFEDKQFSNNINSNNHYNSEEQFTLIKRSIKDTDSYHDDFGDKSTRCNNDEENCRGEEKKQEDHYIECNYNPMRQFCLRIQRRDSNRTNLLWQAFDMSQSMQKLTFQRSSETAVLDGMKVGSILWIVMGHVMALMSSSRAGYLNPQQLLPPNGITTTVLGQLLFSSRLAVDTFLCIGGFLVVHVMRRKLRPETQYRSILQRYFATMPKLVLARLVRILPLYALCLGFYIHIAPHLGSGPFWYQWHDNLQSCQDYGWTNMLFINNLIPWNVSVTDTCFCHSWYLAADMQLFIVGAILVFWYIERPRQGRYATLAVLVVVVIATFYLSYTRRWSLNTFDGEAFARYDREAYTKPHIRASSYLTGMYVAMLLPEEKLARRSRWAWYHHLTMAVTIVIMATVTFITAFGAYSRRSCQHNEWPQVSNCGSEWSTLATTIYTGGSRCLWTTCIGVIMYLCIGRPASGNIIASILSLPYWKPMKQLSFGVYLIHPIVIFVWQLGAREKQVFRILSFVMDWLSICVVSYLAALLAYLVVESPCAALWKSTIEASTKQRPSLTRMRYGSIQQTGQQHYYTIS